MSKFIIFIPCLFLHFLACTPLLSGSPQLESIDPVLWDTLGTHQIHKRKTFTLTVTSLNLNDNTDLGHAFSELYLGDFFNSKIQSYFSVQNFMYGGNQDRLSITLDSKGVDSSDKIDICLISGKLELNILKVKNKLDCKSFYVSKLIEMKEKEFSLENTSANTPKLELLIHL